MHDRADPLLGDERGDQRLVGDVALVEGHVRRAPPRLPVDRSSITATGQPASSRASTAWLPI